MTWRATSGRPYPAEVAEGWRGVVATAAIAAGDVVLTVPGHVLMSGRSASADLDLAAALEKHGAALTPADRLARPSLPFCQLNKHCVSSCNKD